MSSIAKSRFLNIDALRGIAAFLVVLYHFEIAKYFYRAYTPAEFFTQNIFYSIPAFGYAGVYLFFVISGFCIHLRWAKAHSKGVENPKIDFVSFWKRRWIRLYPAYLATIALFLSWQYWLGTLKINAFFVWDLISHFLMIHNFDNNTVYSLNGVLWTLAIEEQLYLIYFLLLYLRRKMGWARTLAICFFARFAWLAFIMVFNKLDVVVIPFTEGALANWWIWALGAIAVENYLGIVKFPRWCYSIMLSSAFLISAAAVHYLGMVYPENFLYYQLMWLFEPFLWGFGFFLLINRVMEFEGRESVSLWVYKILAVWAGIGLFSYSLYLTHEFIINLLAGVPEIFVIALLIGFAYVFFLVFEKPSMKYLAKKNN